MHWLLTLTDPETAENLTLQDLGLAFRGAGSVWPVVIAALALLVILVVSCALYFTERGRLGVIRRLFLALVRIGVLGLLLVLLLRPVVLAEYRGERARPVVLLLDDSLSMEHMDKRLSAADRLRVAIARGLVEPNTSLYQTALLSNLKAEQVMDLPRHELIKAVLRNPKLNLVERLAAKGPIRAFLFGEQVRSELPEPSGDAAAFAVQLTKRLTAKQPQTALGDALVKVVTQPGAEAPAAVVVMTDGKNNAGAATLLEAAEECARARVPLYIYGVGSSEGGALQLVDVSAPETIFYDDVVNIPVRWRSQGFKKGTVLIRMMLGKNEVARKEVTVQPGQDMRDVLSFLPRKDDNTGADKQELTVSVELKGNAEFRDEMKHPVRLSDSKVKVLVIEYAPRWEFKFLQPMLLRDRRVEADFLLLQGDPRLTKHRPFLPEFPKREDLLKYSLILLGDVPAGYLGKERMDLIKEFVRDFRGGLIVIAGPRHNPSSYSDTAFAELLPVEFLPVTFPIGDEHRSVAYSPVLTRSGEMAPMLALADDPKENTAVWKSLPGFYWSYPVSKLRPAATPLLVHPHQKMPGDQPMPILATQYYGKGQVLFLATDETWRWRYNAEDKYYSRFWGQVIYHLALPHLLGDASRRVQVALERSEAILNREGYIYARLLDQESRPLTQKEVSATLEYLDAGPGQERSEKVTFQAIPGRPGEYRLFRKHALPGGDGKPSLPLRYALRFHLPGEAADTIFEYRVKAPPGHELEDVGLAEEELREAARVSGGEFYREEDLHRLANDVHARTTPFTLRQEYLLWHPAVFFVFLALITVEWVVRKFSNLS